MGEILVGLLIVSSLILWFWAITDITRSRFSKPNLRTASLITVLFFPMIGSILYFQLKKQFITKERRVFRPDFGRH